MANLSLSFAIFLSSQKHTRVLLILKKLDMDAFELQSYCPVSNLTFISKFWSGLLHDVCLVTLKSELYQLLPRYQSAYRLHHSTETALIRVVNDILRSVDSGNVCALVLLDLSAAFDTVDHGLLLNYHVQQVWVWRTSSPVATVIPYWSYSDSQHHRPAFHADHSVMWSATRVGPGAGTIHYVHRGPQSSN